MVIVIEKSIHKMYSSEQDVKYTYSILYFCKTMQFK